MIQEYWVLEGDYGGQVYLSIPKKGIGEEKVAAALCIIDALEWDCNGSEGAAYYCTQGRDGGGLWDGMGGGQVTNGLWLHDQLLPSLKEWIQLFFAGNKGLPSPEEMTNWFIREAPKWQRMDQCGITPTKKWWKKFRGQIRRAQKMLEGNLENQEIAFGPLIATALLDSDSNTSPE